MTKKEALELLSYHSGRNSDIYNEKWKSGFLGMLRPFIGRLSDENFIEIMECLKVLTSDFKNKELNHDLISDVWGMQHYSNMWVEKGGMLETVMTEEQKQLIKKWTGIISYTVICLLANSEEAFYEYEDYLEEKSKGN
ncbi:hypothetical protein [Paenibacillus tundrae]|uniref:hypothetical protein n=1 Tax=Paenibacillus tundrae TaxID=528187 RepID=UPI0030D15308